MAGFCRGPSPAVHPNGIPASPYPLNLVVKILAHRNRSDFCDLRLRCPSRTPEIQVASDFRDLAGGLCCPLHVGSRRATALSVNLVSSMPAGMSRFGWCVFALVTTLCPGCVRLAVRILQSWRRAALKTLGSKENDLSMSGFAS